MQARVLLLGANGQVGQRVAQLLGEQAIALNRSQCDLSTIDEEAVAQLIATHQPTILLNAAAFTAVDAAEEQRELATRVNATAVGILANACAKAGIPLLHLSTDYVFDGTRAPYAETADCAPLNQYGASKWHGEKLALQSGAHAVIVRLQWVYDRRGTNFFCTMKKLMAERSLLRIVADQRGAPSSAKAIAAALVQMLPLIQNSTLKTGIYHLANAGSTSWHGFACAIAQQLRARAETVATHTIEPITTAEYPVPAQRPRDTRMNCATLAAHGIALPHWQTSLAELMEEHDAHR